MTSLTFSAILISYNQQDTIGQAAQSALEALGTDGELICVDDGSTDETILILTRLAEGDSRVRVLPLPHSGRPAVCRNAGIAAATGGWVSFLDGDDLYDVQRFDQLRPVVEDTRCPVDLVFHNHLVFTDGEAPTSGLPRIDEALEQDMAAAAGIDVTGPVWHLDGDRLAVFLLATRFVLQTSSFCVRRGLLHDRQLGFEENRVFGEDNPFMLACAVGSRVRYVPSSLTYYRKHWGSLTARIDPAGHREQLRSLHEQVALVQRAAPAAITREARGGIQQMLYEATLHQGYLLERTGQSREAARLYLTAAATYRSGWAGVLAFKALVRRPKAIPQVLAVGDTRTK